MTIVTTNTVDAEPTELPMPTVIDLGKKSRKRVRKLRRGKPGGLMNKVREVLEQMKEAGAIPATAHPVVIVVRERNKGGRYAKMWGMG